MTILNNIIKGNNTPELHALKEDLVALKNDGANLAQHINENASNISRDSMDRVMASAKSGMHNVEDHVKAKPSQSILLAFAAGMAASHLMSSRR